MLSWRTLAERLESGPLPWPEARGRLLVHCHNCGASPVLDVDVVKASLGPN